MQAYELEFVPAQLSPLHIADGIRAETSRPTCRRDPPRPERASDSVRPRLMASFTQEPPLIFARRRIGTPRAAGSSSALSRIRTRRMPVPSSWLAAVSRFPEGVSVTPRKASPFTRRARFATGSNCSDLPDGGGVTVRRPRARRAVRVRRAGDQFESAQAAEETHTPNSSMSISPVKRGRYGFRAVAEKRIGQSGLANPIPVPLQEL